MRLSISIRVCLSQLLLTGLSMGQMMVFGLRIG
jgi:hypothetical protein